jgi:hypothetical protein
MSSQLTKKLKQYYLLFAVNFIIYIYPVLALLQMIWSISCAICREIIDFQIPYIKQDYKTLYESRRALAKEMFPKLYKDKDGQV